jgi:hypothetical protein
MAVDYVLLYDGGLDSRDGEDALFDEEDEGEGGLGPEVRLQPPVGPVQPALHHRQGGQQQLLYTSIRGPGHTCSR